MLWVDVMRRFDSSKILLVLAILCVLFVSCKSDEDPGYDLFFTTNLQEFEDLPIHFSPPPPYWLQGSLIRNVAARFELGNRKLIHVFDAFAKLYRWNFHKNQTTLTAKFIKSGYYNDSIKEQTIAPYLLAGGAKPGYNELQKIEQMIRGLDNMNVNVNQVEGRNGSKAYVALSDYWTMYQFDAISLATMERINAEINGQNPSSDQMSAAHMLPEKGTTNFFTTLGIVSYVPFVKSDLSIVRIKTTQEREILVTLKVDRVPYIHSFAVTEHYVVLFAPPFYPNVAKLVETAEIFKSLEYYPEEDTKVYVVNIKTKEVIEMSTPNVFPAHHVNAFESTKNELVIDICTYKDPGLLENFQMEILKNATRRNKLIVTAQLKRYFINLSDKTVTPSVFPSTKGAEFANLFDLPAINEGHRFGNYCFVYGWAMKVDNKNFSNGAIIKKNLCKDGEDKFWRKDFQYSIEPFFVGRPNATDEDDGVLLVPILDGPKKQTYLAVFDAKKMNLISKAYLPATVPFSFHGRFFSG